MEELCIFPQTESVKASEQQWVQGYGSREKEVLLVIHCRVSMEWISFFENYALKGFPLRDPFGRAKPSLEKC